MTWLELHDRHVAGLKFKITSVACPEQYDVFQREDKIGYVRLRHGRLTAEFPDCGGKLIFEEIFPDQHLGQFTHDGERIRYLSIIAVRIPAELAAQ